jgi:transposase
VVDLPESIALEVSEHRAELKACPGCGRENSATFPDWVGETVGYGPGVKALLVYLNQYQLLPYDRSAELLADVFGGGSTPGAGTLYAAVRRCHEGLEGTHREIKAGIVNHSGVVDFDETGLRVERKGMWLHVASTPTLTHYAVHPKRGSLAAEEIGILPSFVGGVVAVHDGWSAYRKYEECEHALCNAHHLRELVFVEERLKQRWAGWMSKLLVEIKESVDQARAGGDSRLAPRNILNYESRYQRIVQEGHRANPPPKPTGRAGRPKRGKAGSLLDRLENHREEVLRFMHDFRVPFDNNLGGAGHKDGEGRAKDLRKLQEKGRSGEVLPSARLYLHGQEAGEERTHRA